MAERTLTPTLQRLRAIVRRWRLDGRLPTPVSRSLRSWIRARAVHTAGAITSRVLPPAGRGRRPRPTTERARAGLRTRWAVGDLDRSRFELMHHQAAAVIEALEAAGLAPYLVEADGRRLTFGLPVEDRHPAWAALGRLGEGWQVRWWRGLRSGIRLLEDGRPAGTADRAERWAVHRVHRIADGVVAGPEEAAVLTFWAVGASGRREQLGERALQRHPVDPPRATESIDGRPYPGITSFPVGRVANRVDFPIDVVYTWVDGADPAWEAAFERWTARERPQERGDHAVDPGRYRSRDELRYSLRSLWLNVGWVRRIHLVTAGQVPTWLRSDDRLRVVHHDEIFPAEWLPTFNSHAIEARLHHIDGLSEHFLYLNDDVFIGRPLVPSQLFTGNGLAKVFPSPAWIPIPGDGEVDLAVDAAARRGRCLIEETFGRTVARKPHHAPFALRRSVLAEIEERFPDEVERTARSRFRHPDDLSIPSAFAHHYAYCTGRAVEGSLEVVYENIENRKLQIVLDTLLLARGADCFCLNETEAVSGRAAAETDQRLTTFLEAYFPISSPWEAS
jgi:hypothetical protein